MSHPFRPSDRVILTGRAPVPHLTPVDFAAPTGRRVRLVTTISGVIFGILLLVGLAIVLADPDAPVRRLFPGLVLVVVPLVGVTAAGFSQILGYRLTADELWVFRRHRHNRFALAKLTEAAVDPEAMAWSLKIFGNDGLGAITGRFRNRHLGVYQALVTDRQRAVVLRWPGRCLVVSPDRPEEFAREIQIRAQRCK